MRFVSKQQSQLEGSVDGQLYVGTVVRYTVRQAQTLSGVKISLASLPTGADFKIDVRKNGTATTDSIFTSDAGISILTTTTATNGIYTVTNTAIDNGTLVADDVLYVIVTQVGSTLPGNDLYFVIY